LNKQSIPEELKGRCLTMLDDADPLVSNPEHIALVEQTIRYIEWIVNLPWDIRSQDTLDLVTARQILDKNHYGLDEVKTRVLEYLAVLKLKQSQQDKNKDEQGMRAPILCFVGLVGTGKTTIAISIAEAMGRQYVRIPFGGMSDSLDLRGQARVRPDAEVGLVIKALRQAKTRNPVILLDEVDRVADATRADIMGVLVELLDPKQNFAFRDHYIDYPFDLSEVLFIATANNTTKIATAVLDRLEPIQMPSYSDSDKIAIGKEYVLPKLLQEAGLAREQVSIDESIWPQIVRPLGYDSGIRSLERTINGLVRKIARQVVEGKVQNIQITQENVKEFIPQW
jgi:ATP-dependent Lon protease